MINEEIDYAKLERVRDELRYPNWTKVDAAPNTYFELLRDQILAVQSFVEEQDQKARLEWEAEFDRLLLYGMAQVLYLADAYAHFTKLVKDRNLDVIKRSDFKELVVPLIQEQFGVRLRNDLVVDERGGVRGWKNVKLQTAPT